LVVTTIIFGATFMLACMTLTRGQRVIAYIAAILIWILPLFLNQFLIQHPSLFQDGPPPANLVGQVMHLSLAGIPPSSPSAMFLWNRLFFLGLSLILLALTIYGTHALRRHA
jgi:hypothetical protein